MYGFILNMWIMRRYVAAQIQLAVDKEYITPEQAEVILAKPQVEE